MKTKHDLGFRVRSVSKYPRGQGVSLYARKTTFLPPSVAKRVAHFDCRPTSYLATTNSRVKQMENRRPGQPHQTEWHWIPTAEPARRLIAPDIWRRSRRRGAKKHCSRGEPVFDQSQGPSEMSLPHVLLGIAEFREDVSGLLGPPKQDRQEAGIVPRSWQRARPLNCLSPASW